MNPVVNNQTNSNAKDPLGPNSNIQNFVNSTTITRTANKEATLADKIGIDVAKREEAKKKESDHAEKISESGPLSFKSGDAPGYIKDMISRETGTVFSAGDYIIHHPGDRLVYLKRKIIDNEGKEINKYFNFTISDSDIVEAKKPAPEHDVSMMQVEDEAGKEKTMVNLTKEMVLENEPTAPITTEQERLINRKKILDRIADQYRTEEDRAELQEIEKKLKGDIPPEPTKTEVLKDSQPVDTAGTLGTITIPNQDLQNSGTVKIEPEIKVIPEIVATAPTESVEPVTTTAEPINVSEPEKEPEMGVAIESVPNDMSSAKSLLDIQEILEKMDGIETVSGHVGYAESWEKAKQFMAGEISKAELPDSDEFLTKLVELKKTRDEELELLGLSVNHKTVTPEAPESEESEDVTDIIKPRHVILGTQIEVTDDHEALTADLSDSERDMFNSLFKNVKQPTKKIEVAKPVSVPLSAKNETQTPVENLKSAEQKYNRAPVARKFKPTLNRLFAIRNISAIPQRTKSLNETMNSTVKTEPEVLFNK